MKQLFLLFSLAYFAFSCVGSQTTADGKMLVKGVVVAEGKPLADVIVTDGFNFTQTNSRGKYKLAVDSLAKFISVVTPSGYVSDFSAGVPDFYLEVSDSNKSYDFTLKEWGDKESYSLIAIGDIQYASDKDLERFETQVFPDLDSFLDSQYVQKDIEPVMITLGDITGDHFELYDGYIKLIETLPAPMYPVIGNHDHDQNITGDVEAAHVYNKYFGPTYYAFNLGKDYFVVLDNIVYEKKQTYAESLDLTQQEWLAKYLSYIPKGSNVYICQHAPLKSATGIHNITANIEEWIALFDDYNLKVISGHTHLLYNREISQNVYEHNVGAACGAWWTANCGNDGAPQGYQVFDAKEGEVTSWIYKSVGYNLDHQIKIHPKGKFKEHPKSIVAHIWAVTDRWDVKGYFGSQEVTPTRATLPSVDYEDYLISIGVSADKVSSRHANSYFVFDIPAGAEKSFKVVAIDDFGNRFEQSVDKY